MNEEAKTLVTKLISEGKNRDDVHRSMISFGYGTDGLEEEYLKIQKDLGLEEPTPEQAASHAAPTYSSVPKDDEDELRPRQSHGVSKFVKLIVGVVIIVLAIALLSGYGSTLKSMLLSNQAGDIQEGLTPADLQHKTTLDGLQLSANRYKSTLLDYGGVCDSIGIDAGIYRCVENIDQYAIETALSNNSYYCVDSSGFSNYVSESYEDTLSCQ
ncbi:MAG: hypothetical protein ACI9VM_000712 [Candidatus Azotimanducaceae bacterium]|jgi:hypothetical protein